MPSPDDLDALRSIQKPLHYSFGKILRHIRTNHPGCPTDVATALASKINKKNWRGESLGTAVGIELQNYIRHSMTDYDAVLRRKIMTREEARAFFKPEVREILASWGRSPIIIRLVHARDTANHEPSVE